jgi:NADH-quinone oxidoreductase subunit M
MLTAFLIAWPILSALLVYLVGSQNAKRAALASTIVQLGITAYALIGFQQGPDTQYAMNIPWIPSLGIHFNVGMDGISMLMVLLTNLLLPLIVLSSFRNTYDKPALFYGLVLFMQAALVGVFVSLDAFLYYVFWELALIPIYFIILFWGGNTRVRVTFKFFIYTIIGSLLMLVAFIYMYLQLPVGSEFSLEALRSLHLDASQQTLIFWAFFIAYAIKMPVFPFHTWQPDTYTEAPSQGTMLLSGIMLKMGIYSVIRWMLPVIPIGIMDNRMAAIYLAVAGIIYGSWLAVSQNNMKRLFAYSSIAHVGLIAAGIFTPTLQGLQGGMIQMLSHGINVIGLFFVAQIIFDRLGTHKISEMGGIVHKAPVFATLFMIVMLGSVALPLTNGFIGEFLLLSSLFQVHQMLAAIAGLTIIMGAVYMLRTYQKSIFGEEKPEMVFPDLYPNEAIVLVTIAILIIVIGVYPKPILALTEPAIRTILDGINQNNFSLK